VNDNHNLLTPEQVAEILQVHVLTIYGYIRKGKLDAVRLGRNYRIIPEELTRFIESNRIINRPVEARSVSRA
jgi:excisionase family DNA binding protein